MKIDRKHTIASTRRPIITARFKQPLGGLLGQLRRSRKNQCEFICSSFRNTRSRSTTRAFVNRSPKVFSMIFGVFRR